MDAEDLADALRAAIPRADARDHAQLRRRLRVVLKELPGDVTLHELRELLDERPA